MAILIKHVKEYANTTPFPYKVIRHIYDRLIKINKKEDVTLELIEHQVRSMVEQGITTTEGYDGMVSKFDEAMANQQAVTQPYDSELLRKKLGYDKNQWAKIKLLESGMKQSLQKLITESLTDVLLSEGKITLENLYQTKKFNDRESLWKSYCREHIIPKYPGALGKGKRNNEVRLNILGTFRDKLELSMGKQSV